MKRICLLTQLTCGLCVAATWATAVPAQSTYDGGWSVTIITESGTCDQTYRYPVQIAGGTVAYDYKEGSGVVQFSGKVDAGGQVKVSVRRGDQQANGTGKLSQNTGTGTWQGKSATAACAGRWEANRS